MLGLAGVTAIDCSTAAVTVKVVLPEIVLIVAAMVEVPAATLVARPDAVTVAADVLPEVHVTLVVISCDVPSE